MDTNSKTEDRVPNPRPWIANWWAAEAMIASYNYVYQVAYRTKYTDQGPIGISIYGDAPVAPFQYEFLALSENANEVMDAILSYPIPDDNQYVINVFHPQPSSATLKSQYSRYGHEFVRTGPILGLELSGRGRDVPGNIHKAHTLQQAEMANYSLAREGERIQAETLRDEHIQSFYATVDGEVAGWLQLVTVYPQVGYINQLYVLKSYRQRGIGTAMVKRAHLEAYDLGLKRMVLIPSEMGMPLYRRLGYSPLLYFSVFRPDRDE